jgi:orotate phosphoribosyltransferase
MSDRISDRMSGLRQEFIAFCIECGVLRFGNFVTKSGRQTPYFVNAGLFNTGAKLDRLAGFNATSIQQSGLAFDMLFGPAYKGIALAAGTAMALRARAATCRSRSTAKRRKTTAKAAA